MELAFYSVLSLKHTAEHTLPTGLGKDFHYPQDLESRCLLDGRSAEDLMSRGLVLFAWLDRSFLIWKIGWSSDIGCLKTQIIFSVLNRFFSPGLPRLKNYKRNILLS